MTEYHINSLYSGSGGNSVLVRAGGVEILIDAGKSARTLCRSLTQIGTDIKNIAAIFITHEHIDHVGALEVLLKKCDIPIHMTTESANGLGARLGVNTRRAIVPHTPTFCERVGGLTVSSFSVPHDSECCVGYRIEFDGADGEHHALGVVTDMGCVTENIKRGLEKCESVVIECNHDRDMLACGCYPAHLKSRILSRRGHLSNEDCAEFAAYLAESGTRRFLLAHISRENNHPDIALAAVRAAVPDESIKIITADPNEPVLLV